MKQWRLLLNVCTVAWLIWGCAAAISEQSRALVTYHGAFDPLQRNPGAFKGHTVLLGGKIIETHTERHGSDIVVLQLQLDASNHPLDNDQSGGRFIVRTDRFLDPALYARGVPITVVGKLIGSEIGSIGELQFTYPIVELIEIRSWPAPMYTTAPRFHIGIGFGASF